MNKNSAASINLVLRDPHGKPFPLQAVTMIGREAECQIVLADSKVSRYHAKLTIKSPSTVMVEDLHSTNGTYINGQRVNAPRLMTIGDELRLHKVSLRLTTADSGEADATMIVTAAPAPATQKPSPAAQNQPVAETPAAVQEPSPAPSSGTGAIDADSTYLLNAADLASLDQVARREIHVQRPGESIKGPCLLVLSAPIRGKVFALRANGALGKWTLGRSKDADLELIDRTVSREHARIVKHGTLWQIVSINAANKVYVNGHAVEVADLKSGDRIRLGRTEIEFRIGYDAAEALPALTPQGFSTRQIALGTLMTFLLVLVLLLLAIFRK
jgi:pSer/pThr/pTyr-binding forkhead associated (FHA) protein